MLATHLIGSAEYWVLELAGGRDVQRDRLSEFRATGTGVELAARYERWLTAMQELLHAVEHCALHQGHLELTRQMLGYAPAGAQ